MEELECPVCTHSYEDQDPRILVSCGHTVCLSCAKKLEKPEGILCPLCRTNTFAQAEALPKNFTVLKIADALRSKPGEQATASPCANCHQRASLWCAACREPICSDCIQPTHNGAKFANHKIVQGSEQAKWQPPRCSQHPLKPIKLYCSTCYLGICELCEAEHSRHSLSDISKFASEQRSTLLKECSGTLNLGIFQEYRDLLESVLINKRQRLTKLQQSIAKQEAELDRQESALSSRRRAAEKTYKRITELPDFDFVNSETFWALRYEIHRLKLYPEAFKPGAHMKIDDYGTTATKLPGNRWAACTTFRAVTLGIHEWTVALKAGMAAAVGAAVPNLGSDNLNAKPKGWYIDAPDCTRVWLPGEEDSVPSGLPPGATEVTVVVDFLSRTISFRTQAGRQSKGFQFDEASLCFVALLSAGSVKLLRYDFRSKRESQERRPGATALFDRAEVAEPTREHAPACRDRRY